jgi:hypothetical protein
LRSGRHRSKFLEQQLGVDLDEGRQGPLLLEEEAQGVETLGEAAEHVHGEDAVRNGLAELDERVGEGLHPPAVVGDGESALTQCAKLGVDKLHACLAVAYELLFKRNPRDVGRRSGGGDDLEEVGGDGAVQPGQHMKIHLHPVWIIRVDGVAEDVIGKGVLAKGEEHMAAPFGEGGHVEVEGHRNESADVEDAEGLRVEGRNGIAGHVVGGNG